ncbi:hypothetical protein [Chengkuizengella marina]|uniref:SPOR domain-containing protein n=1 Tax=Chengkuizengella marina TaxID=2507566 RepID=A0A6N9Q583_9BACL|nr:hypothetical protein [Chengkuizengella marina]NBI29784.1 hypothetical protein [Chengkuizengella marina]
MDKARLTYRFDKEGNQINKKNETQKEIISLNKNEFKVLEKSDKTETIDELSDSILDSQPLNQFTTDYGAWSSPFDAETARLEQLIRETDTYQDQDNNNGFNNKHRGKDREDDLLERFDSHPKYSNEYQKNPYQNRNHYGYFKKTKRPWFKIITSFTGAIIVGIAFGFFVLSFFSENPQSASELNQSQIDSTSPTESDEVIENENNNMSSPQPVVNLNGTISLNLPLQSYYMLQNGVFSSLEGAEEAIAGLSNNGFAAVSELNDNYYVFAGMTTNRDDALLLSYKLQQEDLEVYIKSYEIPSIQQMKWNNGNDAELVQSYFSQGSNLVHTISELTLIHLKDQSFSPFENSSLETIKGLHQTWAGLIPQMNNGFPEEVKSTFEKMNSALSTAMISLEDYQKNPSSSLLWQTQTALMQYTILQKDLLQRISVSL